MLYPYIHGIKLIIMMTQLVKQAVELFVETLPFEGMSVDHPEFHHLYSQECKLYDCMRRMSADELKTYGVTVRAIAPEDGDVGVES
jgi:hypothetical protein